MKLLIQRVREASVTVDKEIVGAIGLGALVFLGFEREDTPKICRDALLKLTRYRFFADSQGKMNLSIRQVNGALLLVSQFTLVADAQSGLRPSFTHAASPQQASQLFNEAILAVNESGIACQSGVFAADMQVALVNDGPVTFYWSF